MLIAGIVGSYKKIGILGGMGPEATMDLYRKIISIFQQEYDSIYDDDFPEIIICSLPIPDVVERVTEEDKIRKMLLSGVQRLEKAGADFIAIPCNTVSYYLAELREVVSIPILSILEETAKEVRRRGLGKVGLIGTEMTIEAGIYSDVLGDVEIISIGPKQRKTITRIILNILAGNKCKDDQRRLEKIILDLKTLGAQEVILGCTELPLLIEGDDLLNTTEILAKAVVRKCMGE